MLDVILDIALVLVIVYFLWWSKQTANKAIRDVAIIASLILAWGLMVPPIFHRYSQVSPVSELIYSIIYRGIAISLGVIILLKIRKIH